MRRYFIRFLFVLNDILAILLAFYFSFFLKNEIFNYIDNNKPGYFLEHWNLVIFSTVLWIIFLALEKNYIFDEKLLHQKLFAVIKANISSFLILTAFLFAGKISYTFSRIIMFSFFISVTLFLAVSRIIFEKILKNIGLFQRKTTIIGLKKDYDYFLEHFGEQFNYYNLVKDKKLFDSSDELIGNLQTENFGGEQLFILAKSIRVKKLAKILRFLEGKYFYIKILPELGEFDFANMDIYELDGNLLLQSKYNLLSPIRNFTKRIFDFVASIIILILLSPLFLLIALGIKMTSKGPVFFGHTRIGKNRKKFKCWKFRTMVSNAEEILKEWLENNPEIKKEYEKDFKLKHDPRITSIGNFLRKTSLDELPQLFNVLIGNMGLVGPRPIVQDEIEKYGDYGETLFRVLPGITGLWQTSGRNDIDYKDRIELDMYYIKNWSLWLDLVILINTIPAVLKRKGAY